MDNRIKLFYLSPNPYGGWVTFTAHLYKALKAAGLTPELYKIRERGERKKRDFGYGIQYRNSTLTEHFYGTTPMIIVAAAKKYQAETIALLKAGAYLVLHDPTELKNLPTIPEERTIVIRQSSLKIVPKATFIRHPYERQCNNNQVIKTMAAVSTARIDFDKHTDIILDANKLLPSELQVQLHGFENRIYGRFTLMKKYPEWKEVQSTHKFDRDIKAVFEFLLPARFAIDMSIIKGDGGGTQYTFLEAWDAGAIPVIHEEWTKEFSADDMQPGLNCLESSTGSQLAILIKEFNGISLSNIIQAGYKQLELHKPKAIGREYAKALGVKV